MTDGAALQNKNMTLTLASKSKIRAQILAGAGLAFNIVDSAVDEDALKAKHKGGGEQLALALAQAKAQAKTEAEDEAQAHGAAQNYIIGADQILACDGRLFDKPKNMAEARDNLLFMRGKTHSLFSGVALVKSGECVWSYVAEARLTMRVFSPAFLEAYLATCGDSILSSVGCYRLEGEGTQLFSAIEGDYFTILGLPLVPLLDALRAENLVLS